MRDIRLKNSAFTLLEVLIASIIFIIAVAGVFATLSYVREPVVDKQYQLTATVFGNQVLEYLRSQVNGGVAATFYSETCPCTDLSLGLGTHLVPSSNFPTGISWPQSLCPLGVLNCPTLSYTVTCADGTTTSCSSTGATPDIARQVSLTINWPNQT